MAETTLNKRAYNSGGNWRVRGPKIHTVLPTCELCAGSEFCLPTCDGW
ncbi:hypothetical protein COLO4_07447 [Corchorus olitorius]|uniref:Uncharacterized protein n=1 Tax=Corchorus olitorius TaxID=93759 RepID=A0A1R3KJT0_9ROSI|nr:hypothetical protein COLO4_07447 [Corchorus olitorius]